MDRRQLTDEELLKYAPATHVTKVTHDDLTEVTADTPQTIPIDNVKNRHAYEVVETELVEAFEDFSDAEFDTTAIIIGDDGDTNRFLASQELNANGTVIHRKGGTGTYYQYGAANTVDIIFAAMTAKALADIDTGILNIYVKHLGDPTA